MPRPNCSAARSGSRGGTSRRNLVFAGRVTAIASAGLASVATVALGSACSVLPPPERPVGAPPPVRALHLRVAKPQIVTSDSDCHADRLAPLVEAELERALAAAGYGTVLDERTPGAPADDEVTLALSLEAPDCAATDGSVASPAFVRLDAAAAGGVLFRGRVPWLSTVAGNMQDVTYADWAARLVNELTRSRPLFDYSVAIAALHGSPPIASASPAVVATAPPAASSAPPVEPPPRPALPWAARTGVSHPADRALAIGAGRTGASTDAERFSEVSAISLGIPRDRIRTLEDSTATNAAIEDAIQTLAKDTPEGATAYLYFTAAGGLDASGAITVSGAGGPPIPVESIARSLGESNAKRVFFVLDAGLPPPPSGSKPRRARAFAPPRKVVVVSDTSPGAEDGRFTSTFLEAVATGAADIDGDGNESIAELTSWVGPRVARAAKEHGIEETIVWLVPKELGDPNALFFASGLASK